MSLRLVQMYEKHFNQQNKCPDSALYSDLYLYASLGVRTPEQE